MTDKLQDLLTRIATEMIAGNASGIADELKQAAEAKLSVSIGFKLVLSGSRITATGNLGYSRKFTDESQDSVEIDDPKQPRLNIK